MKEYLRAQNKTNDTVISGSFSTDELNRFSKSDYRWADNRSKQYRHKPVKKGEIYQFEFGKNFQPEMSYEHSQREPNPVSTVWSNSSFFRYIPKD